MISKLISSNNFQGFLPNSVTSPALIIYLLFIYTFPFNAGGHINLLIFTLSLIVFIIYVFIATKKYKFSLIKQLKDYHPMVYYILWGLLLTCSLSFLNILFSDVPNKHKIAASLRFFIYFLIICYTFALARFCIVYKLSHTIIFFYFILGITTLAILQILTYLFGKPIDATTWFLHPPFGHHIRDTGDMAAVAVVASIVLLLFLKKSQALLLLIISLTTLTSLTFLIWTGGRAGIVSVLMVSALILLLANFYSPKDYKKLILIIFYIAISFPLAESFSVFPWNGIKRTTAVLSINKEEVINNKASSLAVMGNRFTTGRTTTWELSLKAVKKSPWLGLGPNGFYFIPDRFYGDHPHNFIIQFLVEWGVIGTVLLLLLLLYFAWYGIKQLPEAFRESDSCYIICASVVLILTLNALIGGSFFMLQPLFCLVTAFAVFPFAKIRKRPLIQNCK